MNKKELELEYLRDTGHYVNTSETIEDIEFSYTTDEYEVEVEYFTRKGKRKVIDYTVEEKEIRGTTATTIDTIDENFHNWCIEKLLEYKNNDNKKDILSGI